MVNVVAVSVEHLIEPLGIGRAEPRLSWQVTGVQPEQDWHQVRYQVETTRSGVVEVFDRPSEASVLVPWPAPPLSSRERASVRIRVHGADGSASDWSDPFDVEAGLLSADDWTARMIAQGWPDEQWETRRPPRLRRRFVLPELADQSTARLYITAHGLFEAEINGVRVGSDELAPGWTVYDRRLRYFTYDVSSLLHPGENVIGVWLGDGWYRGRIFRAGENVYGPHLGLVAQLEVHHPDGRLETIATDEQWEAQRSPILSAGLYDGETFDARIAHGFDVDGVDNPWRPTRELAFDPRVLTAPDGPPVRVTEERAPVSITSKGDGRFLLDFGQNIGGRLRIRVGDQAQGAELVLRHAEILQEDELYVRPLRSAKATDTYIHDGQRESWEARFTTHGFRYAEVSGWTGPLDDDAVVARVIHTDMRRTGDFECSDPLVNRLYDNAVWSMRGNFVDVPTDCPQRDERLGWTGDIQVFAPTAAFMYDCSGLLVSWLKDLALEQFPDGTVPWYVPNVAGGAMWTPARPGAVWGDVAVLTPWTLYERFGDAEVLARQFDSARAWVDLVDRLAGSSRLWNQSFQLGDWLDPSAPPNDPAAAQTDPHLIATAYFAHSAATLAKIATVLGRSDEATRYGDLAADVSRAFRAEYCADGALRHPTQAGYAIALTFGLYDSEAERDGWGLRLANLVDDAGYRISTGFAGTPVIAQALTLAGQSDAAYGLLLEQSCPSWLYSVSQGATTIWERWDSLLPDGTVNPGTMTSFNHYALGSIADWLHGTVAGISPAAPGYRRILVRPRPGGGMTFARAHHETPYGRASIDWRVNDGALEATIVIPPGTTALIDIEGVDVHEVPAGEHRLVVPLGPDRA